MNTIGRPTVWIGKRAVGEDHSPLVVAEIGINHEGDPAKARRMIDDAANAGCECVKFQTHIPEEEMVFNTVVPANATEPIWDIIVRCTLSAADEADLKSHAEKLGLIFLSTPFSRAAADRLDNLGVCAFKIGSGECNNYAFIDHVASKGKPVILSTGMNDLASVTHAVRVLRSRSVPYVLLHCTSTYPTTSSNVRLGSIGELRTAFPDAVVGLSDHCQSIYPALGGVALGASVIERHFTSDKRWPGPDIEISMDPTELAALITGSIDVFQALGGGKTVLDEERPTIEFAFGSVVALRDLHVGEVLTADDVFPKRPGTGEILAPDFDRVLGHTLLRPLTAGEQLSWEDLGLDSSGA